MENLEALVLRLIDLPTETMWVEFKHNNFDSEMIGKDICALANSATYSDKACSYMVWGIDDTTHKIIGTDKSQYNIKKGGQELESWLRTMLSENVSFTFEEAFVEGKRVVVLNIERAELYPVKFKKVEYIRVGSYTKPLAGYPTMQAKLWDKIKASTFEDGAASDELTREDVLRLLDYGKYFELKEEAIPTNSDGILHYMIEEGIVREQENGAFIISNLGAILFAKKLDNFPSLQRKAVRVVQYEGRDKLKILKDHTGTKGYAVGFEGLMEFLEAVLPSVEEISGALRTTKKLYPMVAIREIISNALIHQDFSMTGTGPVIEIFKDRIEFTNPGKPLVDVFRIVDNPPKSRNERLASLMRRMRMCEELGSGWDRIVVSCEMDKTPAPQITLYEENTKVVMHADIAFQNISPEDKLWSCYLHSCIKYLAGDVATNSSLRDRFGLSTSSSASISRLIKEAVEQGYIKPLDPNTAPRHMKYIPIWA